MVSVTVWHCPSQPKCSSLSLVPPCPRTTSSPGVLPPDQVQLAHHYIAPHQHFLLTMHAQPPQPCALMIFCWLRTHTTAPLITHPPGSPIAVTDPLRQVERKRWQAGFSVNRQHRCAVQSAHVLCTAAGEGDGVQGAHRREFCSEGACLSCG
jgi:hypothetical protein